MKRTYNPVARGYHDKLLALATLKRECDICYVDETGKRVVVHSHIKDVFSKR